MVEVDPSLNIEAFCTYLEEGEVYEIDTVLGKLISEDGDEVVLVKWKAYPLSQSTFEPMYGILFFCCFLNNNIVC